MMREPASGTYTVALTGDVIMNTPVSACRDDDVMAAVDVLRTADVTHAHLEIPLHDFAGADVFGAAEGALSWMRGPTRIADELRWLGVDVVSAASNHSLDYSYGGLGARSRRLTPRVCPMPASAPTWPPPARRRSPTPRRGAWPSCPPPRRSRRSPGQAPPAPTRRAGRG